MLSLYADEAYLFSGCVSFSDHSFVHRIQTASLDNVLPCILPLSQTESVFDGNKFFVLQRAIPGTTWTGVPALSARKTRTRTITATIKRIVKTARQTNRLLPPGPMPRVTAVSFFRLTRISGGVPPQESAHASRQRHLPSPQKKKNK